MCEQDLLFTFYELQVQLGMHVLSTARTAFDAHNRRSGLVLHILHVVQTGVGWVWLVRLVSRVLSSFSFCHTNYSPGKTLRTRLNYFALSRLTNCVLSSSPPASPNAAFSPANPSKPGDQRDRSRSKSPVPPVAKPRTSGTALLPTPPTSQMINARLQEGVQKSHLVPPVRNGESLQSVVSKKKQANSRTLQASRPRSRSRSRSPSPPQRTLSSSSHSERSHSRSRSHTPAPSDSQNSNVQSYKPIHSPIKISSGDSDSYSPLANENGIPDHSGVPEQYKRDYEHDRRVRKSRHKHRPDKREKHHRRKVERSSSHERRRHRHREQRDRGERDVYWERERDRDIFRDRERDVYVHDRDREYSKLRKSDSHRYR